MLHPQLTNNLNTLWSTIIIDTFIKNGLETFFISPGNRNASLITALVYHPKALKKSIIDERSAAYCALGYAKANGKPGVLVCTSGTAIANYFPAIIEAARDEVPIIVLSADRPPELVGSDANQTINQVNIFGDYCQNTLSLPCPSTEFPINALVAKITHSTTGHNSPVHINCPFRDPLTPESDGKNLSDYIPLVDQLMREKGPRYQKIPSKKIPTDITNIQSSLENAERGLLVLGRIDPWENIDIIANFAINLKWPVYCDITSQTKWRIPNKNQILTFDHPQSIAHLKTYHPDLILQLGSALVSKKYYEGVAADTTQIIQVSPKQGVRDPGHQVNIRVQCEISTFINTLSPFKNNRLNRSAKIELIKNVNVTHKQLNEATPQDLLSFPLIAQIVTQTIPEGDALFLGNSMTIRAFESTSGQGKKSVPIISNRGVSGIEGNVSTGVGFAEASQQRTTILLGDISFLHDLNALILVRHSHVPIILIIVNNHGGRIFERLPINKYPEISTPFMTTPHKMNFKMLAGQFEIPYFGIKKPADFKKIYANALASKHHAMIELHLSAEDDLHVFAKRNNLNPSYILKETK